MFDQGHREPLTTIEGLLQRQASSIDVPDFVSKLPLYRLAINAPRTAPTADTA